MSQYIPPYTITSKIFSLSSLITEELVSLEHANKDFITPLLRKKNRIKTLAGTLEIEGNFLGEEKITAIVDGKRVIGTINEVAEVEGAIHAYKELENYKYYEINDLLYAHKILMQNILSTAGSFRNVNVRVGDHVAPQPYMVPELVQQLFAWLKTSEEHPLIKSCVFHYEFEFIHPFSDGNGRIGRLWQSVILYSWKKIFNVIPTESIIRDHQEEYYRALENASEIGESTPFIEFMLEVILESIRGSVKSSEYSSVNTDEKILNFLQNNPTGTIKQIAETLGLTTRAIEKRIAHLKNEKRLQRSGSARKGEWKVL
jgi:Fic family protein